MDYITLFRMPQPVKITGRSSSITNAFVNSIIPVIVPSNEEIKSALEILGMNLDTFQCSYCGSYATEWDHLRPLVVDKKPTGYISEIDNLVPACGKCNQSKGNKLWDSWIVSNAKLSPKSRGISDLGNRIIRLRTYEERGNPKILNFESIVGEETWTKHWANWKVVQDTMQEAQLLATEIRKTVVESYEEL